MDISGCLLSVACSAHRGVSRQAIFAVRRNTLNDLSSHRPERIHSFGGNGPIVSDAATLDSIQPNPGDDLDRLKSLSHTITHVAHFLPAQSPIRAFIHHNTLHAFQDHRFDEAIKLGMATYGCQGYLREDRYRQELARGRILPQDLSTT